MDVSGFSNDMFDVKEWINDTFKSADTEDDKDAFVTSLVMKLQLYVQQVNGSLEETSRSVLSSLPRILRDTQLLRQEAQSLGDKMISVREEIAQVQEDTAVSMKTLERLDRIKRDLQLTQQSLHEADNWTVLANEVEEIFEIGDIETIAGKLLGMQKSLSMLVNAVDYEDKKMQLEGLKNRLEAMASPRLVKAFTANDLEQSKVYVDIFRKIDRLPQLIKYYHNCLKVSLCEEWRRITEVAQDETVSYWLHTFYDKLLAEWNNQAKWCNQVFPKISTEILIEVYADLLDSLNQPIGDSIDAALRRHSNAMQLSVLLECKQTTRNFAKNLNDAVQISSPGNSSIEKLESLARAIYSPYLSYVIKYSNYESAQLIGQLENFDCSHDDLGDTINSLSLSIPRVIDNANEANKRCRLFTDGCGYPGLRKALNTYFNQYLEKYREIVKQLERRKVKHEDWNLFQMCLTLMQSIGELLVNIENLEKTLSTNILETNNLLQSSNVGPLKRYKNVLLNSVGRTEFDNLVLAIQQEDTTLLDSIVKSIEKLSSDLHNTTYEVIFAPIFTQLLLVQKAPAWSVEDGKKSNLSSDLPDFSFAPQEYITQVGQYLMTLPQQSEPFLLRENPSLTRALKAADPRYSSQASTETGFTDILLGIVAKGTCQMFQDQTLGICELNPAACKQLATDIDYLGNVLEELALTLSDNLQQMKLLLRLSSEDYQTGSSGCNARVVAAVRQMRNIASSG